MIEYYNFLFFEIYRHLCNLLLCRHEFAALPLLAHLQNFYFSYMVIFIIICFCCIGALGFIFNKRNTSVDYLIVPIFVYLCSFLSYFFDSFKKSIIISIRIIGYYSHSSINFGNLLPMRHFSGPIVLYRFEFKRISVSSFKLIASMFVKIAYLSNC